MNPVFASPKIMTDVQDKQAVHTARRARWEALGGKEFLPGHAGTPYKEMFILSLSLRKETASLCGKPFTLEVLNEEVITTTAC